MKLKSTVSFVTLCVLAQGAHASEPRMEVSSSLPILVPFAIITWGSSDAAITESPLGSLGVDYSEVVGHLRVHGGLGYSLLGSYQAVAFVQPKRIQMGDEEFGANYFGGMGLGYSPSYVEIRNQRDGYLIKTGDSATSLNVFAGVKGYVSNFSLTVGFRMDPLLNVTNLSEKVVSTSSEINDRPQTPAPEKQGFFFALGYVFSLGDSERMPESAQ